MAIDKAAELAKATPKVDPQKLSKAELLALKLAEEYTPANTGDWGGAADPTTVGEALDRLAKAVAAGNTGPIAD